MTRRYAIRLNSEQLCNVTFALAELEIDVAKDLAKVDSNDENESKEELEHNKEQGGKFLKDIRCLHQEINRQRAAVDRNWENKMEWEYLTRRSDGRRTTWFCGVLSDMKNASYYKVNRGEVITIDPLFGRGLAEAQIDMGYHPAGYGGPNGIVVKLLTAGTISVQWTCAGSCD